jgi:PAS domain S-box-containing protein
MVKSDLEVPMEEVIGFSVKSDIIRVLYVDNDASFLKTAKGCLKMHGDFEVEPASSVEEALKKMKEKEYDAVVSDYPMPSKDDLEFLEILRRKGNEIPFIIFTGKGTKEVAIKALNLGADQYIDKAGAPEMVYYALANSIRTVVESKKAIEELRKSEEKWRSLARNAPNIIIIADYDGTIQFINRTVIGVSPEKIIGRSIYDFIDPENHKTVMKNIEHVFRTGEGGRYETSGAGPDGNVSFYETHVGAIKRNGQTVSVTLISTDITERKNAEKAIMESQQKFEALFKDNPEAAVYLDLNFRVLDVNPRFCQLFGYSADEAKGKHIFTLVVPEDKMEEAETLHKKAEKGYAYYDTVRRRRDGSQVLVSISTAPITIEDKLSGYVMMYKDITAMKKAEEDLVESKRHFQTLFNLMVDPVVIVDGKGRFLEITDRVEEITGFKREELVGKNFLRTQIVTAKSKAILIKNLAKRMMGMHLAPYEVEILTKDGRKLPYEINATEIEYKGKPADLVVFRDISERKKLEEKLRVVGSLTRHDVRNKLSAVTGNAYLLRQRLAGDPKTLEQLKDIEAAVRQVERIFEFAGTYEKLGVEQPIYLDAKKIFDEAVSLFSDLKGVKIVNGCGGLTVLADSLLRQLFHNLIDDSLKYGEKIKQIRVYYKMPSDDKIELVYEDDGAGISSDMRGNLFKEGVGKGTGYGLFMIKRICEVYGWIIQETGTHGKGAQFTITIPNKNKKGETLYKLHK